MTAKRLNYLAEFVLHKIHPLFIPKTQKIEEAVSQQFNIREMQLHLACNTKHCFCLFNSYEMLFPGSNPSFQIISDPGSVPDLTLKPGNEMT